MEESVTLEKRMNTAFISCNDLHKVYHTVDQEISALQGVNLDAEQGEIIAITGKAKAGKSTLVNVIGGQDVPNTGELIIDGQNPITMRRRVRDSFHRRNVGMAVSNSLQEMPSHLSAVEHIERSMRQSLRISVQKQRLHAMELLDRFGLSEVAHLHPDQLSGGTQQKLSLVAAIAHKPQVLLMDEINGQIDPTSAHQVYQALDDLNANHNMTILAVTHDPRIIPHVHRIIALEDGHLTAEARCSSTRLQNPNWIIETKHPHFWLPDSFLEALGLEGIPPPINGDSTFAHPASLNESEQKELLLSLKANCRNTTSLSPLMKGGAEIILRNLNRSFETATGTLEALTNINLHIPAGCLVALKGPNECGKSTLLQIIGGMDSPSHGKVTINSTNLSELSGQGLAHFQRHQISYIHQIKNLLPYLTISQNIETPLRLTIRNHQSRRGRVNTILRLLQMEDARNRKVNELSDSQRKLAAIGKALPNNPSLILADDPTGHMDPETAQWTVQLFRMVVSLLGTTVVIASHDPIVHQKADLLIEMEQGQVTASRFQNPT